MHQNTSKGDEYCHPQEGSKWQCADTFRFSGTPVKCHWLPAERKAQTRAGSLLCLLIIISLFITHCSAVMAAASSVCLFLIQRLHSMGKQLNASAQHSAGHSRGEQRKSPVWVDSPFDGKRGQSLRTQARGRERVKGGKHSCWCGQLKEDSRQVPDVYRQTGLGTCLGVLRNSEQETREFRTYPTTASLHGA